MIRRRPTLQLSHSGWFTRSLMAATLGVCLSLSIGLVSAPAAFAEDDAGTGAASTSGMPTQEEVLTGMAKVHDILIIRPLSTIRVIIGSAFMIPAAILSSPSGMEGIQASYDTLIDAPVEYAFRRPLGDFSY